MADENVVSLSANQASASAPGQPTRLSVYKDGQPAFLDIVTGDTYDTAGNSLGKWNVKDDAKTIDQNKHLALYAADYSTRELASTLLTSGYARNQEVVTEQAKSVVALSRANAEQRQQMLDIGTADVHIAAALPNFITGYSNEGAVADIYSPAVVVPHQSDYYYQYQKEDAFQRAMPNIGYGGANVAEVSPRFGSTKFNCVGRAVGGFIPTEVEGNQDPALRLKQAFIDRCMNVIMLERELRVSSTARTSANWNSATTLSSTYQWNGGAASDPVKDINYACETSYGRPSGIIIPEPTWNGMRRNPAVRAYYAFKDGIPGIVSEKQLVELLDVPMVYVARMKYINSSGSLAYCWGNDSVVFRTAKQIPPMDTRDTASSYTFRWVGPGMGNVPDTDVALSPSRGFVVRQFFNQFRGPLGGMQIVVTHFDAEKQTSAYIGNLILNTYR